MAQVRQILKSAELSEELINNVHSSMVGSVTLKREHGVNSNTVYYYPQTVQLMKLGQWLIGFVQAFMVSSKTLVTLLFFFSIISVFW